MMEQAAPHKKDKAQLSSRETGVAFVLVYTGCPERLQLAVITNMAEAEVTTLLSACMSFAREYDDTAVEALV